jgi:hypothetical protein
MKIEKKERGGGNGKSPLPTDINTLFCTVIIVLSCILSDENRCHHTVLLFTTEIVIAKILNITK